MEKEQIYLSLPFRAYMGKESYIFISYAHVDKDIVYPEMMWLKKKIYLIWYDEGIPPASEWPAEIEKALSDSQLVLVFITPNAIERRMIRDEINYAIDHNKFLLTVFLEPTDLKHGLSLRIGNSQHLKKYELKEKVYQDKLLSSLKPVQPFSLNEKLNATFTICTNLVEISDYCRLEWKASKIALKLENTKKKLLEFFTEFTRIIPEFDKWANKLKTNYKSDDKINEKDANGIREDIELIYDAMPFILRYKKPEERDVEIDEKLYAMFIVIRNFAEITDYCMLRWEVNYIQRNLSMANNKLSQFFDEFKVENIVNEIDNWLEKLNLNYGKISLDRIKDEDADLLVEDIEKFKKTLVSSLK